MNEREAILGRIREALKLSAPMPGKHATESHGAHSEPRAAAQGAHEWLPPVGTTVEEQFQLFAACSADLRSDFHLVANEAEAQAKLRQIATAEGWKKVGVHAGTLARPAADALGMATVEVDHGYDINDLESCDAGITECDALVAQTGSVLVTSRSAGGRALSVLPPHHVVVARRDQLVADLPAAFALLQHKYGASFPSFMSFITGPSRTGDIERILVLGAHGPKKLTILCF